MTKHDNTLYSEEFYNQVYDYLRHCEHFRLFREAYERLTGHTVSLVHKNVQLTPDIESARCNNVYCATLLKNEICENRCRDNIASIATGALKHTNTGTCEGQITISLIPINLGNNLVAYLKAGQIKLTDKVCDKDLIYNLTQDPHEQMSDYLVKAFRNLEAVELSKYRDQLTLISALAIQLSDLAKHFIESPKAETLLAEKCKFFISQHLSEQICQDEIAQYVGVSTSHMCKQFKKNTDLTLVEFINAQRVKMAKKLLKKNLEMKVIDIAFQCGFQSLSQFNRTFKKIATCSPSQYRTLQHSSL